MKVYMKVVAHMHVTLPEMGTVEARQRADETGRLVGRIFVSSIAMLKPVVETNWVDVEVEEVGR